MFTCFSIEGKIFLQIEQLKQDKKKIDKILEYFLPYLLPRKAKENSLPQLHTSLISSML